MAEHGVTIPPALDPTMQEILSLLKSISIRSEIVDNLTTGDSDKALSARQGQILKGLIDNDRGTSSIYDPTATYAKGDFCIYNNTLYKANQAVTAEAWDATKWDAVNLSTLATGVDVNAEAITSLSSLTIGNLKIFRTNPYTGTTSSQTTIGTVTLDKGKYLVWASGASTLYEGYLSCTDYTGYVSNAGILNITTQQSVTVQPASSSSMNWYIYSVIFLKIE